MYAKLSKCSFAKPSTTFLGFLITERGIEVDPSKVAAIVAWPAPTNVTEVRRFLGTATHFRKFVPHFSTVADPLHKLCRTKNAPPWLWTPECQAAFEALKKTLMSEPVLKAPNFAKDAPPYEVVCDASNVAIGAVLTQGGHAIAYESRKLKAAELNYTTTEVELLAVVHALRTWHCYVEGVKVTVVTDHCPLTYLQTQPQLSRRQVRWSEYLQTFEFDWKYRPGKTNPADALSRLQLMAMQRKMHYGRRVRRGPSRSGIGFVENGVDKSSPIVWIPSSEGAMTSQAHMEMLPPKGRPTTDYRPSADHRVTLEAQLALLKLEDAQWRADVNRKAGWAEELRRNSHLTWRVKPTPPRTDLDAGPSILATLATSAVYGGEEGGEESTCLDKCELEQMLCMLGTLRSSKRIQSRRFKDAEANAAMDLEQTTETPPAARSAPAKRKAPEKVVEPLPPEHPEASLRPTRTVLDRCKVGYAKDAWFDDGANTVGLTLTEGIYRKDGKAVVPDAETLRSDVLYLIHDSHFGGHVGAERTWEQVQRDFWWPTLRADVNEHVRTCEVCQRDKTSRQLPTGMLQPLEIPERRWESVSMDFITALPETLRGHTQIVVFVDRLSKMTHLVPLKTNATALDVAQCFVHDIFRLHGLPRNLVSDRDAKFTSALWKEIFRLLGPDSHMSTAYHPQSDGQTENMNRTLEDMLRHWINPSMDNWDELLDCAEFAINNAYNLSVKNTPFRLNSGQNPLTPLGLLADTHVPRAHDFVGSMHVALRSARQALLDAQARQKQQYDEKHRHQEFKVGDMVLLRTSNIRFKGPNAKKLLPKWIGPMEVMKRSGELAYHLKLPSTMKIHPVFHTSLLKPHHVGSRSQPLCPKHEVQGDTLFDVEAILDHRVVPRKGKKGRPRKPLVSFLVQWSGYGKEHNSWEPEAELDQLDLMKAYKASARWK